MSEYDLKTPVALCVFNRPQTTRRVFDRVAQVEPSELYVIADGPRPDVPEDEGRVEEVHDIVTAINWDCELRTNFAETNLGVKERLATGLSWVFDNVDEAIILEDDCLPHLDFFRFCERMLEMYRGDERVMDVTGTNAQKRWKDDQQDYHFSFHGLIWGWATWADAWDEYDPEMALWSNAEVRERVHDVLADDAQYRYTKRLYDKVYRGELDTWDYQWGLARQRNSGLSVVPSRNLVTNIGFESGTFHENAEDDPRANLPTHGLEFPIERNPFVAPDRKYDRRYHDMRAPFWYNSGLLTMLRDYIVGVLRTLD